MTAWQIKTGDNLETLRTLPDACIDAVVTDPPYGLSKEPDVAEVLRHWLAGDDYHHAGGGFMGKTWDSFVPGPSVWRECLRVLKPGGHLLAFFGTRTYDLGCMAVRLAGFQVRDQLAWMYGTGFPKSKNVAMAIDKGEGVIDHRSVRAVTAGGDLPPPDRDVGAYVSEAGAPGAAWEGWGTALKPAQEPIVLARKPLIGTVAKNVLEHGTGGLNVDGCRIGSEGGTTSVGAPNYKNDVYGRGMGGLGRCPANVLLDEEAAGVLDKQSVYNKSPSNTAAVSRFFYVAKASKTEREAGLDHFPRQSAGELTGGRAEGSAGLDNPRAGAGRTSKGRANTHPTVKPIALMRYLVRLVTPPGGVVLDPYAGSATTIAAAVLEGFHGLGCELSEEYARIARARITHWENTK